MRTDITLPASLLPGIGINVKSGLFKGTIRLRVEGDWLVAAVPTSTIRFRPQVESGKIILTDLKVSGLLGMFQSSIIQSLNEGTETLFIHDFSIRDQIISFSFSPRNS